VLCVYICVRTDCWSHALKSCRVCVCWCVLRGICEGVGDALQCTRIKLWVREFRIPVVHHCAYVYMWEGGRCRAGVNVCVCVCAFTVGCLELPVAH